MVLEICASNYQSAVNAQIAGAQRIELCTELAVGGLTPSYGILREVLKTLTIPAFVLIRPRGGNFTYSEAEFEIMKHDIRLCKDMGYAGVVSGILNKDHTVDTIRTKQLIELTRPLSFTFHRAFDLTSNPIVALEQLIDLGVNRVLTSGQDAKAEKGLELLKKLNEKANGRIIILPGGGINADNAKMFKDLGFKELHASAAVTNFVNEQPIISMNTTKFFDEKIKVVSNIDKIKDILNSFNI